MAVQLVTGNHAAGYALSRAGEANRKGRGVVSGIYPITPQTEIVEYVAKFPFEKGKVVAVESEHSAMGVCIGASLHGARSFTASASNGLAYMAENIMVAAFYRLPIVMVAVNRTLGPPWNIWADQGDSLMFRDFGWIQFYCNSNQDVADTSLLAFRLAEDKRILLPVMICMDAFIVSHTAMQVDLPDQSQVDAFLPICDLPHRLNHEKPFTTGGLAWPRETASQRVEMEEAVSRVPEVFEEHRKAFEEHFGRSFDGMVSAHYTEDADHVLVASSTVATTALEVVKSRRAKGEKVGLIRIKMFRPFPTDLIRNLTKGISKIGVLDRNYAAGVGGIFCHDVRSALQGVSNAMVQSYLTGVGGGDVVPQMIDEVIDDLKERKQVSAPIWKGVDA